MKVVQDGSGGQNIVTAPRLLTITGSYFLMHARCCARGVTSARLIRGGFHMLGGKHNMLKLHRCLSHTTTGPFIPLCPMKATHNSRYFFFFFKESQCLSA